MILTLKMNAVLSQNTKARKLGLGNIYNICNIYKII